MDRAGLAGGAGAAGAVGVSLRAGAWVALTGDGRCVGVGRGVTFVEAVAELISLEAGPVGPV